MFSIIQIALFAGGFAIAIALAIPCQRVFKIDITPSGRDAHLDGLRALAALAVVTCHINQSLISFFGYTHIPQAGNHFGVLGVKIFFALTAYLFTKRAMVGKLEPIPFLIGRFRRIMPLYFAVATTAVLFSWLYYIEPMPPLDEWMVEIFRLYTYAFVSYQTITLKGHSALELIGVAWTLSYEWQFYLFLVPAYFVLRSSRAATVALMVVIIFLAAFAFWQNSVAVWTFFIAGSLAALLEPHFPPLSAVARSILMVLAIGLVAVALDRTGTGFAAADAVIAGTLFMTILLGKPRVLEWAPLQLLGRVSYSIYLLQYLVLFRVANIGFDHGIRAASPVLKYGTAWAAVAILVPLSCATYKYIEMPFIAKRSKQRDDALPVTIAEPRFQAPT